MPAPTFNQQVNGTTATPAFAANPPAGATVVLVVLFQTGPLTAVSGCGATWTLADSRNFSGRTIEIWIGANCSGSAKTITMTGISGTIDAKATSWAGGHPTAPLIFLQITPGLSWGTAPPQVVGNPGPIAPNYGTIMAFAVIDGTNLSTLSPDPGITGAASTLTKATSGQYLIAGGYTAAVASGSGPLSYTLTGSSGGISVPLNFYVLELLGQGSAASHATVAMADQSPGFGASGVNVPVAIPLPLTVRIYDGADVLGSPIAQLGRYNSLDWLDPWNALGSGSLVIPTSDPVATRANIAKYNLVRVFLGAFDVFDFWITTPQWTLASPAGESGNVVKVAGRGLEHYLHRAVVLQADPTYTAKSAGYILDDLLVQAQLRGALSLLTHDFNAAADSAGVAWPAALASLTMDFITGTNYIDILGSLRQAGVWARMRSDFTLQMWGTDPGRDLTSSVVLRQGKHLLGPVTFTEPDSDEASTMLARSRTTGLYSAVDDLATTLPDRFEGYVEGPETNDIPTMIQYAAAEILRRKANIAAIKVRVHHGMDGPNYEPYRHYTAGDRVALLVPDHFDRTAELVASIHGSGEDSGLWTAELDLAATQPIPIAALSTDVQALKVPRSS